MHHCWRDSAVAKIIPATCTLCPFLNILWSWYKPVIVKKLNLETLYWAWGFFFYFSCLFSPPIASYCTLIVLILFFYSPPAIERLSSGLFQEVIVTNTIPAVESSSFPQLTVLSVANLLGETIWRVHDDCSVSSIFQWNGR